MARVPPLVLVPPVAFAALAGLLAAGMWQGSGAERELPSALVGQQAPALPAATLGDLPPLDDAALRDGRPKVVNFFASWCAPCRIEHPALTALAEGGLPIYGVAYKDDPANSLAFLAELGNPYAAAGRDPDGAAALDWGVYGVPETFVLDGEGRVVERIAGPIAGGVLEDRLLPALREAE